MLTNWELVTADNDTNKDKLLWNERLENQSARHGDTERLCSRRLRCRTDLPRAVDKGLNQVFQIFSFG